VLFGLMQSDLKSFLANGPVENIGVIFIGLGLALAIKAQHLALAASAALFQVFNHSLFKSLLLVGAGAVLGATGERYMDKLGGLIWRMSQTSLAFLGGAVAVLALPPLKGLASERLTFQAVLVSPQLRATALKFLVPAVSGMLALAAALTAAAMVRAYCVALLGRPCSAAPEAARETDRWSRAAMFALAGPCLLAETLPAWCSTPWPLRCGSSRAGGCRFRPARPCSPSCRSPRAAAPTIGCWFWPLSSPRSGWRPWPSTASPRAWCARLRTGTAAFPTQTADPVGRRQLRPAEPPSVRRLGLRRALRGRHAGPGDMRPARFTAVVRDRIWEVFYASMGLAVGYAADLLNRLQYRTIRVYLSLVFVALVSLRLVLALWD
jgi:hydrogenase-4 component B